MLAHWKDPRGQRQDGRKSPNSCCINTFINNEMTSSNYRQMAEIERSLGADLFLLPRQRSGFNMLYSHQPFLNVWIQWNTADEFNRIVKNVLFWPHILFDLFLWSHWQSQSPSVFHLMPSWALHIRSDAMFLMVMTGKIRGHKWLNSFSRKYLLTIITINPNPMWFNSMHISFGLLQCL